MLKTYTNITSVIQVIDRGIIGTVSIAPGEEAELLESIAAPLVTLGLLSLSTTTPTGDEPEGTGDFTMEDDGYNITVPTGTNPLEVSLVDKYIYDVIINDGGADYTSGSLVVDNTGTSGSGLAGTFIAIAGIITAVTITNAGSGYETPPAVDGDAGGSGADLTAVVRNASRGIKAINFSNPSTNTATFYFGKTSAVTAKGTHVAPGEDLFEYPVAGDESFWVYATALDETFSAHEIKRVF